MKLDAGRLGIAMGGATAIFWIVCSALVALFSGSMMTMTGHMLHMDASEFAWRLTFPGFFMGLVSWTVCAAVAGWLIGWIYNATEVSPKGSE
jgi:hypothetical protein